MLNQNGINQQLWKICDNFKNRTEMKENYIVYISALLYIRYYGCNGKCNFDEIYNDRNNFYIRDTIDRKLQTIIKENNIKLFSNIKFRNVETYRDIGEQDIIEKTIEEMHKLLDEVPSKNNIAEAYDYILEQSIYRNDIGNDIGEFYTPIEIADVMARMTITKPNIKVYDPVCSSGNILKSAAQYHEAEIYGRENDLDYYNILKTRLLLNEIKSDNISYADDNIFKNLKPDVILSNPPFADRTWKDNTLLKNGTFKYEILPSAVGDYIYVLNMLDKLNEHGKMCVILPHGVLFRENERKVREGLINDNYIEAIIGLPENLFHGTRIPVIMMVISKNREEENVLFVDASQDYENDRKNNILSKEYQEKIIDTYVKKKEIENYSHLASKEEIINNKFDLTIKKYIYKKRELEIVDRKELTQNVKKLKLEQEMLEENIKDVLEVLGYSDDIEWVQVIENEYKEENKYINTEELTTSRGVDYSLIGRKIKDARKKKGMSQEQLAEKMDVSIAFVSRIERGTSQITLRRLTQICEILDTSEGEILRKE